MAELPGGSATTLLALAEKTAQAKDDLPELLDLMASWVRDVAVARQCPDRILHQDLKNRIMAAARGSDPLALTRAYRAIEDARRRIRANANPRLAMESLWLSLAAALQDRAENRRSA
jgi:DNA polymerase III gamma/tau subunit